MPRSKFLWIALFLLMLFPMVITFTFYDHFKPPLKYDLASGWINKTDFFILSDILFFEAGIFLFFGAMLGGAVLFTAWKPDRLGLFVEPVYRLTILKKERDIPSGLLLGLLTLFMGIFYISVSIFVSLRII